MSALVSPIVSGCDRRKAQINSNSLLLHPFARLPILLFRAQREIFHPEARISRSPFLASFEPWSFEMKGVRLSWLLSRFSREFRNSAMRPLLKKNLGE